MIYYKRTDHDHDYVISLNNLAKFDSGKVTGTEVHNVIPMPAHVKRASLNVN